MITKQQKIDMVHGLIFKNCSDYSSFHNKSILNINKVSEYVVENIETLITLICEKNNNMSIDTTIYEREHIEPSKPWPTKPSPPPPVKSVEDWNLPMPKKPDALRRYEDGEDLRNVDFIIVNEDFNPKM